MNDTPSAPALEARGVWRTFGKDANRVEALRGIDLRIDEGEFVTVMGPSGSGKSTLLHLLGGLAPPSRGSVHVGGQDLAALDDDALTLLRRRRLGFVFQAFNLLPSLTAVENVELPLLIDGVRETPARKRAAVLLDTLGLGARLDHLPGELSGGEQQRVAIARAMVAEPLILLADEPTGNLDSASSAHIVALLVSLVEERRQTLLLVTHDARSAAAAHRVIRLRDGAVVDEQQLPRERRSLEELMGDLE